MTTAKAEVQRLLDRAVRAGLAPGFVAAWGPSASRLEAVAVGHAALVPTRETMEPTRRFDLASLTKPLATTTLALLLERRGALSLETRVGEVLDRERLDRWGERTVLELLTHTSGLPAWAPLYARGPGRAAVLECLRELPEEGPAGRQVVYSCPGFVLLGLMMETLTGASLGDAFRHQVSVPLGLEREVGYRPDPGLEPPAAGARRPGAEIALLRERDMDPAVIPPGSRYLPDDGNARALGGEAGNAGLFGTARGVAVLALEYVAGEGRLLSDGEIERATSPHTPGLEQARGLGWQLAATPGCSAGPSLPPTAFGHTGFTGCSVWVDARRPLVSVLLSNRHHPEHRGVDLHPLRRRFHTLAR